MSKNSSSERIEPLAWSKSRVQYILYLRHLFAYHFFKRYCNSSSMCLDYGGGDGYGAFFLSKFVKEIHCVDVDPRVIKRARVKYKKNNLFFQTTDGKTLPFKNDTFQIIISGQVIEHLKEPIKYLKESWRVLQPGGFLLLTTPNRAYRLKDNEKPWNRFHVTEYNVESLRKLLKGIFTRVEIRGIFGSEEIREIEKRRVMKLKISNSLDVFNLRKLLSPSLEYKIVSQTQKITNFFSGAAKANFLDQFSINDFYTDNNNLDKSLDLIAIFQK